MYSKGIDFAITGSMFVGAIFMSNRKTKLECLKRKVFGLPASQAGFVKKIKAGMLLFLFEYEERQLYGVFEATSDGALNIIPNAYISLGQSFPAQILFKRIWMCKPLAEEEFSDAIKENYYQPSKFNFGLSFEQVYKLIHLFFYKRIGLEQYRSGIPNMVIQEFEKSRDHSKYYHRNVEPLESFEVGRKPTIPDGTEPLTDLICLTSQNSHSCREHFHISPYCDSHDSTPLPGSGHEYTFVSSVMDHTSLSQESTACIRSPKDTLDSLLRSQLHPLQPNFSDMSSHNHSRGTFVRNKHLSYRSNSLKDELGMHSFTSEPMEENEHEDQKLNHTANADECCKFSAYSKLRSDNDKSRTSVFSRLSRTAKPHEKYDKVCESCPNISLGHCFQTKSAKKAQRNWNMGTTMVSQKGDQQNADTTIGSKKSDQRNMGTSIVSQKMDRWNMAVELEYKQPVVQADDEERVVTGLTQNTPGFLGEIELGRESITIKGSKLPFFNFKRRSEARKTEHEAYSNDSLECGEDSGCMKPKRRRLVRPSFIEEATGSPQETVPVEVLNQNGELKSAGNITFSANNETESELTDGYPEGSLRNNNDGTSSCRSAISSGNARWLLLKSIFDQVNSFNRDPTERDGNANDESDAVSGSVHSFSPVRNPQDQEIGGVDGVEKGIETQDFLPLG